MFILPGNSLADRNQAGGSKSVRPFIPVRRDFFVSFFSEERNVSSLPIAERYGHQTSFSAASRSLST